jgi:hypothetical protein
MKTNGFLLFFCFSFFFTASFDAISNGTNDTPRQIELKGDFTSANRQRSLTSPIQVFISEQSLQVNLQANQGNLSINIYDEYGAVVYQESVNTSNVQLLSIDITSFGSGSYTIVFINAQNQYLQGDFEID